MKTKEQIKQELKENLVQIRDSKGNTFHAQIMSYSFILDALIDIRDGIHDIAMTLRQK